MYEDLMKLKLFIVLGILLVIVLGLSPYLDQQLAVVPYNLEQSKFYGEIAPWCKVIYDSVAVATILIIAVPLIMFLFNRNNLLVKRMFLVSFLGLALGPGLLVNLTFKEHWGRARPYQVIRDNSNFSLPWQPHFDMPKDNSFPSGHESIGAFIGIPFIAYRRRKLGVLLSLIGAVTVGIVRWLQGGHYFTDICASALMVWMISILVFMLVDKLIKWKD